MKILLTLLVLSTTTGQLLRIPYLQGTGILVTDILLGIVLIAYLIKLLTHQTKIQSNYINLSVATFLGFTLISLLCNIYALPTHDLFISAFYYLRFAAYTSLFFVFQSETKNIRFYLIITLFATVTLCLLGFLQLRYFPDFETLRMQEKGWDPHINRLLSTWYDPNFLGGFFVFTISLLSGIMIINFNRTKNLFNFLCDKININYVFVIIIILTAIFLTYSRSAYLALIISVLLLGLIASRKFLVVAIISGLLLFSVSGRVQSRVINAYHSAQAILNPQSIDTLDATAKFRYQSWQNGLSLFNEKPVIGHGYNTLRYIQAKRGYTEWKSHAAGGIDSSLLTLLVTTGSIGILLYLNIIFFVLRNSLINFKQKTKPLLQGLNLGFFCGLIGLIVHSFFVNSLLYPFIMIFIWSWAGLLSKQKNKIIN